MGNESFANHVLGWACDNFSDFPWRRDRSPYEVLVAELLLKRTTATAAARSYADFLIRFPSLQHIESTSEEELAGFFSGVGLQRQRARSTKRLATWILTTCDGRIPHDLEGLMAVPGLGDYSSAAILSFGYGVPVAVLDANVERIIVRVFGNSLPLRPPKARLKEIAQHLLPKDKALEYNYGLLDLGRLVCRYIVPNCGKCPLNSICDFYGKSGVNNIREVPGRYAANPVSKLQAIRNARGLSQKRLAEFAGVSKLTVIRIESGKTSPRPETLEKLGQALEASPEELIGFAN